MAASPQPSYILQTYTPGELTGQGGSFTFTPNKLEIGQYSVRVHYYSPVNSGNVDQTFLVDVYPSVDYSFTEPTTTCVTDIFPLTLGNYPQINVMDGDYNGLDMIVCGSTFSAKTAINTGYESAFL